MRLNPSRRELLKATPALAASAALTRAGLAAQTQPAPEPLHDSRYTLTVTTEGQPWQPGTVYIPAFGWSNLNLNLSANDLSQAGPPIAGFGSCFNELGWTSLSALAPADRDTVLRELFHPTEGARFTYCRMPIAANDFATGAYSYDDHPGDFDLARFSVDHDRATLIPFIQAAQRHQPALRLWASPWSPPAWMKRNGFYAEARSFPGAPDNGIHPDQLGHEGEDLFLQEPRYFQAYARYFARFIEAYRAEGIRVGMVMPQNEFNSAQNFPSCTWTPAGLARFLAHLGPAMQALGVEVFFGTLERGNPELLAAVMADPAAAPFIQGVGVQWAGKNALPGLRRAFPQLPVYQSEQECGDGTNTWAYAGYGWQLMKSYFRSGARAWMYWNIALATGGRSTWGWTQNSLVTVDTTAKTFRYNPDFYLLKHLTHFVEVGATLIPVSGTCDDALAFRNPDGSFVLLLRNELPHAQPVDIPLLTHKLQVNLPPDSLATLTLQS